MAADPDSFFEKLVLFTIPIWGPFYATFYIIRLLFKELFGRGE